MEQEQTKNLRELLASTYGTNRAAAEDLGVTAQTISNWLCHTPNAALRHMARFEELGVPNIVLMQAVHLQTQECTTAA